MFDHLDPVTFEILRHRLWQITDEMATTISRVSGSPVVTDAGDYSVAIYTAGGDVAVVGAGAPLHISTTSAGCKRLLELYDVATEIEEGDMLLFNDPYRDASHQPDVAIVAPFYHEGELIAWTGAMVHVVDIGGMDPGGMSIRATSVYQEGLRFPGIKIVQRGRIQKDVLLSITNMVREPGLVGLDLRAEIAANNVAHARLREAIARYGRETVLQVLVGSLDYSETRLRARLQELPDGTWRHVEYFDHDGQTDRVYEARLAMTKQGDRLVFDFSESSLEAPGFINSSYGATCGGVFTAVIPLLAYDIPWNDGLLRPVEITVPKGTFMNPRPPSPVSRSSTGGVYAAQNAANVTIARMLGASEAHREDAFAVWRGGSASLNLSGTNRNGRFFTTLFMDHVAGSGGARPFADGVDTGGYTNVPTGTAPNVERHELMFPVRYLYRRQSIDTGGPGRYRGGVSGELALAYDGVPGGRLDVLFAGNGKDPAVSSGLFGGYPGSNLSYLLVRDSDVQDLLRAGRLPQDLAELGGRLEDVPAKVLESLGERDVLHACWPGGGGYGDPLEREPERVAKDVRNGLVSQAVAAEVYGVSVDEATGQVDLERTRLLRRELRAARIAEGADGLASSREKREAQASHSRRIAEAVDAQVDGDRATATCNRCGHPYGPLDVHWKRRAVVMERPLGQAGPRMWDGSSFILRHFFCPGCGLLADTEMTRPEEGLILDEVRVVQAVPAAAV